MTVDVYENCPIYENEILYAKNDKTKRTRRIC